MIIDYKVSAKTKHPACCHWGCCGNKFGRIEKGWKDSTNRIHYPKHKTNRMERTRRYAKRVERMVWKREVRNELQ